jgi:hypothetical protein
MFPYKGFKLEDIYNENEISSDDLVFFHDIIKSLQLISYTQTIDFNDVNKLCKSNNMSFKRFFYIYTKSQTCLNEPYLPYTNGVLTLSCSNSEINIIKKNKQIFIDLKNLKEKIR